MPYNIFLFKGDFNVRSSNAETEDENVCFGFA